MKSKFVSFGAILFLLAALASPLYAGQYFQEFSPFADGTTSFGDGSQLFSTSPGTSYGAGVEATNPGELQLTEFALTNVTSAFELPALDPSAPVYAFSAKWNSDVYGIFPDVAYGFSFNFGQLAPLNLISSSYTQESGYPTGMCFSVETSGFSILVNGKTVAYDPYNPSTQWGVENNTNHFFEVDWNYTSGLTVHVDGQTVFSNAPTYGFVPKAGDRFVWAAQSIGWPNLVQSEEVRLDNIVVMTGGNLTQVPTTSPYYSDSEEVQPATNAFDGNLDTSWADYNAINGATGYVGATVSPAATVSAYALVSPLAGGYLAGTPSSPAGWILQGSNNSGTNWANCGTGVGHFVNSLETRCWMATNSTSYGAYRLNVDVPNGYAGLGLAELRFYQLSPISASAWVQSSAESAEWQAIASSTNGTVLASAQDEDGGIISVSTDSGSIWTTPSAQGGYWTGIASSADGTRLVATAYNPFSHSGGIFVSSNSGGTWTQTTASDNVVWTAVASSADGTRLVATSGNGEGIYLSSNSGTNWTQVLPSDLLENFSSIASSSDGEILLAGGGVGFLISTNFGTNWTWLSIEPDGGPWTSVALSTNGSVLAGVLDPDGQLPGDGVYISTDLGATWTQTLHGNGNIYSIACSADGTKLVAGENPGGIYTSTDSGSIWTEGNAPDENWYDVASSADGSKLAACSYSDGIWTYGAVTPLPPTVFTTSAVNSDIASLNGQVTPNFLPTTAWFEWGTSTNYGNTTAIQSIGEGNQAVSVNATLTGLSPGTTYHYQMVGLNNFGTNYGGDITFTWPTNYFFSIALSSDTVIPSSTDSPAGQTASMAIDGTASTEYANIDVYNTGFTVFPAITNVPVRAIGLISAGDNNAVGDPSSFILYGSPDGTHFTEIVNDVVPPFAAREAIQSFPFANTNTYEAYEIVFPTVVDLVDANSMQIGQVEFLPYGDITSPNDASTLVLPSSASLYNGGPTNALFDRELDVQTNEIVVLNDTQNVVALITPAAGTSVVKGVELIGGFNDIDFPEREATTFLLEGSNDGANYTTLLSVTPQEPTSNQQIQGFSCIGNTNAYRTYRATFGPPDSGSVMEVAELRLLGQTSPKFNLANSGTNLFLSWPVSGFVLQQSTNLASANWLTATNGIVITNGQSLVTIPAAGNNFYRLQSQ